MPILKTILAKTSEVTAPQAEDATISPTADPPRPTTPQMNAVSRKHWWNDILKWFGFGGAGTSATYQTLKSLDLDSTKSTITSIKEIAELIGVAGIIVLFVGIIIYAIYQSKLMKDDIQEGRAVPSGDTNNVA